MRVYVTLVQLSIENAILEQAGEITGQNPIFHNYLRNAMFGAYEPCNVQTCVVTSLSKFWQLKSERHQADTHPSVVKCSQGLKSKMVHAGDCPLKTQTLHSAHSTVSRGVLPRWWPLPTLYNKVGPGRPSERHTGRFSPLPLPSSFFVMTRVCGDFTISPWPLTVTVTRLV